MANVAKRIPKQESNPVEAQKLSAKDIVGALIASGMTTEAIAVQLSVSNHTVVRWRDGATTPQPGALRRLQDLHEVTQKN